MMKKMKRWIALALALAIMIPLAACGGDGGSSSNPGSDSTTGNGSSASGGGTSAGGEVNMDVTFESPVLITSAGQSADIEMVKVMFQQSNIPFAADESVTAEDGFGDAKTLVVVIGGSSKGLGAAGIDADAELARIEELLDAAEAAGMSVVSAHIGGAGRRGLLGDRNIEPVVTRSDYCIVVDGGNDDGLFTDLCSAGSIPLSEVGAMTDCTGVFAALFPQ